MAKYAQATTIGNTCPWGSAAADHPDAFTLAAQKAARRRDSKDLGSAQGPIPGAVPEAAEALKSSRSTEAPSTVRSKASKESKSSPTARPSKAAKVPKPEEMEAKMMDLIQKCLDTKVLELRAPKDLTPSSPSDEVKTVKSSRSSASMKQPAPSHVETEASFKGVEMEMAEAEGVTMAGKRAQIKKLSDASLGKFDEDQSRLAYLEMQRSAAEARNKNRSALSFDYEPPARSAQTARKPSGPSAEAEAEAAPKKRGQAQKLSDASLGKFDQDQSRAAYLEMRRGAAEVRNKNRSAQCFAQETSETSQYPALLQSDRPSKPTMAGKKAQREKVSEAALGKFDADKSRTAYMDMQRSADQLRNKNRVGQDIF